MPEKYQFQELDAETRAYLLLVRDKAGSGVPGVYAGRPDYLPIVALLGGLAIGAATFIFTIFPFPPTDEPAKEAMLQTAGFLVAAWLIVAALRVWLAGAAGRYAGHFVYADPETLYQASGSTVRVTSLADLREARAVQNFNEGNYQNTSVTVKVGKDRATFEVLGEEAGRRMTVFLNAVAYMRTGGEDGTERALQTLAPEQMAAMAKEVARTGQFPRTPPDEGREVTRIPYPRKDGRTSTGILGMVVWALIGVGMFFGFRTLDQPYRQEVVFARIKELPAKERPPAVRMYLDTPAFTAHREEALALLERDYDAGVAANVRGEDAELRAGMAELIRSLAPRSPAVSLVVAEITPPAPDDSRGRTREKTVRTELADKLGSTIGDELVVFAAPVDENDQVDTTRKGMIDVRWTYAGLTAGECVIEFRKTPDDEPFLTKKFTFEPAVAPNDPAAVMAAHILKAVVGDVKGRPKPEAEGDF